MPTKEELRHKTVCFTGHRRIYAKELPIIKARLRGKIIELIGRGYLYFRTGGALGFDTLAAEAVIELRELYPEIRLLLVLPCENQACRWKPCDVKKYNEIKHSADETVCLHSEYCDGCMLERNRYLVDNSSVCVCYLRRNFGGTAYTVRYAGGRGCEIVEI